MPFYLSRMEDLQGGIHPEVVQLIREIAVEARQKFGFDMVNTGIGTVYAHVNRPDQLRDLLHRVQEDENLRLLLNITAGAEGAGGIEQSLVDSSVHIEGTAFVSNSLIDSGSQIEERAFVANSAGKLKVGPNAIVVDVFSLSEDKPFVAQPNTYNQGYFIRNEKGELQHVVVSLPLDFENGDNELHRVIGVKAVKDGIRISRMKIFPRDENNAHMRPFTWEVDTDNKYSLDDIRRMQDPSATAQVSEELHLGFGASNSPNESPSEALSILRKTFNELEIKPVLPKPVLPADDETTKKSELRSQSTPVEGLTSDAEQDAMDIEMLKAALASVRTQSLPEILQMDAAADYLDQRIDQAVGAFGNDAVASEATVVVADMTNMSVADINVMIDEHQKLGKKAVIYLANASTVSQQSFSLPVNGSIQIKIMDSGFNAVRAVALEQNNAQLNTAIGILGTAKIQGNARVQRMIISRFIGQFVMMTDKAENLQGVGKDRIIDVASYITNIEIAMRSEQRIQASA